jgi:single-strand DNA-binding protein
MIIIEIAGHLGADPETRVTPDGQKVTSFRVATNIRRKGADETVWWRVTVWGDRFDKLMPYLKKGSAVIVHGSLSGKPEIYTDKNGVQNVSLDIRADMINFSPFGGGGDKNQQGQGNQASSSYGSSNQGQGESQGQGQSRAPYAGASQVTSGQSQQFSQSAEEEIPF